ncbi:hypothetical protein [uncultured Paracoccus sp.]|uniref:hypothetical protein n=1 Tax=uncultured Paracoccus sp. TaxID=189685 RepID=UPI0025D5D04F|nr:hypothetical protein [uncultured Paracoccus sp.]
MTALALIALLCWPLAVAVLFNRMPRPEAAVWSVLGGYLVLPPVVGIDLPGLPDIGKETLPAMAAVLFACLTGPKEGESPMPPIPPALLFLTVVLVLTPIATAVTNPDALFDGIVVRPGIGMIQGVGEAIGTTFYLMPFLLGFWLLSDTRGPRVMARALVAGVLAYSVLMLIEIRLSPQLNVWIYGFFQHAFDQTMRYGGFRPIVFLTHPLWVAFLTLTALLSAIALLRVEGTPRARGIAAYLTVILVLCKSLGGLMHLFIAAPILWLMRPRMIVLFALVVGIAVFLYPVARALPWVPIDELAGLISSAEAERGGSFEFRLNNEVILLDRALERPWFGWGAWGRQLIVDPESGRHLTIVDGEWIRVLGQYGITGYAAAFGLLLLPLIMLWRAWPKGRDETGPDGLLLAAMALMLSLNMLDLVPNATITPLTWLMAGIVSGAAVRMRDGSYFAQTPAAVARVLPKKTGLKAIL